ncbi:unnamed protein product [Cyprideis torosa]|uniref:Elongation of very long chain fatty acids protein n=1 Tax=Cyprideis torosa TaxID=163714 RepID=A0A7R8ZP84_9CRUS|nr:unnamed protein product [Cyprideis torosa]CAG0887944.1 unnamed protein product [Cyprideis torosa]
MVPKGQNVKAHFYTSVTFLEILWNLEEIVDDDSPGAEFSSTITTPPATAQLTEAFLEEEKIRKVPHPPYSPRRCLINPIVPDGASSHPPYSPRRFSIVLSCDPVSEAPTMDLHGSSNTAFSTNFNNWTDAERKFYTNFNRPPRKFPCLSFYHTDLEKSLDDFALRQGILMHDYWWLSLSIAAIYVVAIFSGQRWMRDRKPYDLTRALIVWNWSLAIFSLLAGIRGWIYFFGEITTGTLDELLCYPGAFQKPQAPGCAGYPIWMWAFVFSKLLELGDTFFIVVRKRPLIFLHYYHHISVLVCILYGYGQGVAVGLIFCMVNALVHFFMYSYYALRSMRIKLPKIVSMTLTAMQIFQMLVALGVNWKTQLISRTMPNCTYTPQVAFLGYFFFATYALLFLHYFYKAYLVDPNSSNSIKRSGSLFSFVNSYNECNFEQSETKKKN